jgi:hypothetical protein
VSFPQPTAHRCCCCSFKSPHQTCHFIEYRIALTNLRHDILPSRNSRHMPYEIDLAGAFRVSRAAAKCNLGQQSLSLLHWSLLETTGRRSAATVVLVRRHTIRSSRYQDWCKSLRHCKRCRWERRYTARAIQQLGTLQGSN